MLKPAKRIPSWIKFKIPGGKNYSHIKGIIKEYNLNTVCLEAHCPNIGECLNKGSATFLILGNICTRNCKYCSVETGIPNGYDLDEPIRVAQAIKKLNLKYVVITSVTRDDLDDGGARLFAETILEIRKISPKCKIEILPPDFKKSQDLSLKIIAGAKPDLFNHNIEVVHSLYSQLRPQGDYQSSLNLLQKARGRYGLTTKSGLMIGFGESMDDIKKTLVDVQNVGCEILTVGQYLKSSPNGFDVVKFYTPDEFNKIKKIALNLGFSIVLSAPLVRSSYGADKIFNNINKTSCNKQ